MRFSESLPLVRLAAAQSCDGGGGTCKYTSDCDAPAYTRIVGASPVLLPFPLAPTSPSPLAAATCCIPAGCVVCGATEERDLEARISYC
ncbi:hypothetical protein FB451DRAFT_1385779 [Mycena latifolia]|nr:hypothetical protein FB451DRAFT_1385779 [Mycena latifolia]